MAAYNKFNATCQDFARAIYNLSTTTTLKVLLGNTVPTSTWRSSTDITGEVSGINGYSTGGSSVAIASAYNGASNSSKFMLLQNAALVFTANVSTGGAGTIGPFEYAILAASTTVASSTVGGAATGYGILGWYDYGSAITLNNTETFTLTWDVSSGILQIS